MLVFKSNKKLKNLYKFKEICNFLISYNNFLFINLNVNSGLDLIKFLNLKNKENLNIIKFNNIGLWRLSYKLKDLYINNLNNISLIKKNKYFIKNILIFNKLAQNCNYVFGISSCDFDLIIKYIKEYNIEFFDIIYLKLESHKKLININFLYNIIKKNKYFFYKKCVSLLYKRISYFFKILEKKKNGTYNKSIM